MITAAHAAQKAGAEKATVTPEPIAVGARGEVGLHLGDVHGHALLYPGGSTRRPGRLDHETREA